MALTCPNCKRTIDPFRLRRRFVCPGCKSKLRGKTALPLILGIVIWSLADAAIFPWVYSTFGYDWQAVAIRVAISGAAGMAIFYFLLRAFGAVELDAGSPAQ